VPKVNTAPEIDTRVGRWKVIGPPEWRQDKHQRRMMIPCECTCGTKRLVMAQVLRRNHSEDLSCGCWKRERTATIVSETRWRDSHGRAAGDKDPLYRLWLRIKRRCYDPNAHNYRWYGALGVKMADEWLNDAGAFIAYVERELGPRPSPQHSIDRYPPDADYAPGKIRWNDPAGQARNRRPRSTTG
jgi:hypothetical protein